MRSFHPVSQIQDIAENVYATIGQHRYSLMKAYLLPWNQWAQLRIDPLLEKEIVHMPSIEDFAASEINETHNRTVRFDYYLGLKAEDERELLNLAIDLIQRYERTYPVPENCYTYELTESIDLQNTILKFILMHPGMVGITSMAGIRAFLDGYFRIKEELYVPLSTYEIKLQDFISYWKKRVNPLLPFETWECPLLYEQMGTNAFSNLFSWEASRFEELLLQATQMELISPEVRSH
jgi:hypothetical protein